MSDPEEQEEDHSGHFIQPVYELLARFGVDPHDMGGGVRTEDEEGRVAIGMNGSKVGISIDGDRPDPFREDGWFVAHFGVSQLQVFAEVYRALGTAAFEHIRRMSMEAQVKTGSKEEELLLAAILKANLPEPNRNFRVLRPNRTELTVPDFTWEDLRVAFFMDGLWWHISKDDDRTLNMIKDASTDKEKQNLLMNSNRSRAERDADNRSELSSMGWTVLSCTDKDLETPKGVKKQVDRIARTLRQRLELNDQLTQLKREQGGADSEDTEAVKSDLLGML